EGRGEYLLTGSGSACPVVALLVRAEFGYRCGGPDDGRQERNSCDAAAEFGQDAALLEDTESVAAHRFRKGRTENAGRSQSVPQEGVETVFGGVEFTKAVVGDQFGDDGSCQS